MADIRRYRYIERLMSLSGNGKANILIGPKGSGKSTVLRILADELSSLYGRESVLFLDMRDPEGINEQSQCISSSIKYIIMAEAPLHPSWGSIVHECLDRGCDVWLSSSNEEDIRGCSELPEDVIRREFLRPVSPSEWDDEFPDREYPGAKYPIEITGESFDGLSWFGNEILPGLERRHPDLPYILDVLLFIGERGISKNTVLKLANAFNRFMRFPKKEKLTMEDMKGYIDVLIDSYLIFPVSTDISDPVAGRYSASYGIPFLSLIGDVRGGEMDENGYFHDALWRMAFSEGLSYARASDRSELILKNGKRKSIRSGDHHIEELPYVFLG